MKSMWTSGHRKRVMKGQGDKCAKRRLGASYYMKGKYVSRVSYTAFFIEKMR